MMKPFLRLSLSVFCGVSIAAAAWAGASAISPKMQQQGEGSFQNTSLSKAAKDTKGTTQRNPNVRQATFRAGEAPLYLYAAVMNSDGWTPNLREPGIFRYTLNSADCNRTKVVDIPLISNMYPGAIYTPQDGGYYIINDYAKYTLIGSVVNVHLYRISDWSLQTTKQKVPHRYMYKFGNYDYLRGRVVAQFDSDFTLTTMRNGFIDVPGLDFSYVGIFS